jgi:TonB-dependent starch-binding outer membrane protein SusC
MRKILLFMSGLLLFAGAFAQEKTIAGKITDARDGTPMIGVTVSGKGSSAYTQSGPDGSFRIAVPNSVTILVFSSVGFENTEVSIGNRSTINVQLSQDGKSLDEVVVVAYGTQRKAEVTGAAQTVKSKDLVNIPRTSVDQVLQGRVAGLQSVAPSGQPGAIQQLRIRGIGSITAGAAPLWVVDGVPVNIGDFSRATTTSNALAGLNGNDIEEITVLKDAAATSIYGSRAANGVILVTTKKGKAGKSKIRVETEMGFTELANLPDAGKPLNAAEWQELTREGLVNAGATQAQIDNIMNGYGANTDVDIDWLDLVTRRGDQQQANISASGGNDKTTYYLSGGYFNQQAPVLASDFKRYSGTMNLTNKFSNRVTVATNLTMSTVKQHTPLAGGAFANPIDAIYFLRPMQNPYNADGTLNISRTGNTNFPADFNPLYIAEKDINLYNNFKVLGNISGEFKILDNLKFSTRYGVDYFSLTEELYDNPFHGDGRTAGGRSYFFYTKVFNWVWTNQLDYRQYFLGKNSDFYADIKLGYEAQQSKEQDIDARKEGFPPTTELNSPTAGATPAAFNGTGTDYTFASVFSAVSVNFKNRYVLTGSFRRDGSSRFGSNNRYGNFWSVGAAWNIDQEGFMEQITFISGAKLRTSYGVNGNGDLANYGWRPLFGYGANYNGQPGGTFNNIGNIDLTWELNKPFNVGLEVGFFNNRLNLAVDYYNRKTSDLLLNRPLSRVVGFNSILQNVGAMQNAGIEITIDGTPVATRDFTWSVNFNFARNKNKITELPGGEFADGANYRKVGLDYQSWYVRQWAGVDPANGQPLWYKDATKTTTTSNYGEAERIIYSSASPKFFGQFNNTFTYKGFSLDFQLYYNFGNTVRDQWAFYTYDGVSVTANKFRRNLERWQKPGDITDVPAYVYNLQNSSSSFSTRLLYKGDFIRLRNVSIAYNLPRNVLTKLGLGMATFYVRGFNLFTKTFDDRLTFDPENGITSVNNLSIPLSKTVTAGLTLEF